MGGVRFRISGCRFQLISTDFTTQCTRFLLLPAPRLSLWNRALHFCMHWNVQTNKQTKKQEKAKKQKQTTTTTTKKKNGEITSSFLRLTRDSNNVLLKTSVYIHSVHVMVLPVKICMAPERVTHKSLNRQTTKF